MSISKPDAAARAAERLGAEFSLEAEGAVAPSAPAENEAPKKRGRPKGTKNKAKIVERSTEDILQGAQVCAFLTATIWDIAAPLMKRRSITDDEAKHIGAALDPVLFKYLPGISNYGLELNLFLAVVVVWNATALPKEPEKKPTKDSKHSQLEMVQ